uniref:Icc protein n=1 Tax=Candidatus Kentrum sp. LFY TaxID=2126342 RepID=A0A450WCL6_9GAMM|nr:MAG: Icc protein [Candidatus Kentron sp. LFY]
MVSGNSSDNDTARTLRVIQISDSHLSTDENGLFKGVAPWRTFQSVVERIGREPLQPDIIVATGDLVHEGPAFVYRHLREHMDRIGVPIYVLPGNHDDPALLAETFDIDMDRDATRVTDYMNFGHTHLGNWLIVFLNTVVPGAPYGLLDTRELARLDALLGKHPDHHALLCLHHHPVPRKGETVNLPGLLHANLFFSVVDRHPQVRGIIWGHIHGSFEARRGKILLLGTPSTCFQFDAALKRILGPNDGPPAYRRLALGADGTIESDVVQVPIRLFGSDYPSRQPEKPSPGQSRSKRK